jgi:hypothetical protein
MLEKEGRIGPLFRPGTTIMLAKWNAAERALIETPERATQLIANDLGMGAQTIRRIRQEMVAAGTIPDISPGVRHKLAKQKRAEERKTNGLTEKQLKKAAQATIDHSALDLETVRESMQDTDPSYVVLSEDNRKLIDQMHNDIKIIKNALAKFARESHQEEETL